MDIDRSRVITSLTGSLEKWLQWHLENSHMQGNQSVLLDVGAYQGDFTAEFIKNFASAILFEPHPQNQQFLKERFQSTPNVTVECAACDSSEGTMTLRSTTDTSTASLLDYCSVVDDLTATNDELAVRVVTLDGFLEAHSLLDQIALLKLDTQGNDLRVIQGAAKMLDLSHPWLVVELIYAPLYHHQAQPHEVALFLSTIGYVQVAQFNEKYTADGWFAYCDGCFVHESTRIFSSSGFKKRPSPDSIAAKKARKNAI